jgi:hypothetical protein
MLAATAACMFPACVSSRLPDPDAGSARPVGNDEIFGTLESDSENYPWLSSKYDKGIYASSAETSPFRENSLTHANLKSRIQKTSKKNRK